MDILEAVKKEMLRRRLSHKTIKTYLFYIRKFLVYCKKNPKKFSKKDVAGFLDNYVKKGLSGNTINVIHNALRFMMIEVLRKGMQLRIRYSKVPKNIPEILNSEEIRKILWVIKNNKHKLIVSLMYGTGLRVSEVVKLKSKDIDLQSNVGWVRKGKGNKDRPFIIPTCLKKKLEEIILNNNVYLFYGNKKTPISIRTIQLVVKNAAKKAKINKNIHPHTFRHSFATHLIEAGNDVTIVQVLLGHNEARTTLGYLHMAKPKLISTISPLDKLNNFEE